MWRWPEDEQSASPITDLTVGWPRMTTCRRNIVYTFAAPCCALICFTATAHAAPVAFWPLDEGAGRIARDASEYWNDAILHNVDWCEGRAAGGVRFGGTDADSFLEVLDAEALAFDDAFTIQFWWKKVSNAVQIFFRKGRQGSRYNYYAYLEGKLHFSVTGTDGQSYSISAPASPDGWHHMAFIYDGQTLAICVDGQVVGSREIGEVRLLTDRSPLLIGTYAPGYKHCLAGTLDEVCISDAGLKPERLQDELASARSLQHRVIHVETFEPVSGALVLAKHGKPGATIVIAASASRLQTLPARELQTYLYRLTGALLPIRCEGDDIAGNLVLVGASRLTAQMGLPGEPLGGDSFIIKTAPGRLVLLGNDQVMADDEAFAFEPSKCKWGTSNAVYAFLHDLCGVRWFMPGKLGEVVPKRPVLEVPDIDVREKPFRTYALGGGPWRGSSNTWSRRNLLGSSVFIYHPGGHLWYSLIPAERHFDQHPDWFALRDGERKAAGNHLCTTNEGMFAEAVANLRAIYDRGYEWVELGQTDGYQRCQCPNCEALDEYREAVGYWVPGTPADRIHLFHAALADEVRKSHPGRKALIISYGPTGEVPHNLASFPENVVVEFTHNPDELLERWNHYHNRFTAYVYWFGTYHRMGYGPKSSPEYVASELRRLRAAGAEAYYFCGGFDCWGTEAPSYYVTTRLLRNPETSEADLVREFCTGLFGSAAPAMEGFFEALSSAANMYRSAGRTHVITGVPYRGKSRTAAEVYSQCFGDATLERCRSLLERAGAMAADEATRRRVRFFRDGFEYIRLTALAFRLSTDWQQQRTPEARETLQQTLRQREDFVDELLARQAESGGDLPPVLDYSREQLILGPSRRYERQFRIPDQSQGQ